LALFSYSSAPEQAIALLKNSIATGAVAMGIAAIAGAILWLIAIWEP